MPGAPPPKDERQRGWLRFPRALLIGVVTGGVAALVTPPVGALVVAGVVTLGLLVPWARAVATVGGIAFVVAGCINVVQGQNVHHYLPGSNWAGSFVHAGNLIWLGVVAAAGRRRDLGPRPAGRQAARSARHEGREGGPGGPSDSRAGDAGRGRIDPAPAPAPAPTSDPGPFFCKP